MKYLLSAFILFYFCSAVLGQPEAKYKNIDVLIGTNSMIDAMNAVKQLKEQYSKDTLDSEYWLRYSKACYAYYNYSDALSAMDKAIQLSPKKPVYYFEKGILLNSMGRLDSALISLERAVQLKPEGKSYYWKGIVEQRLNKFSEAENDYALALQKGFETPELHNNYAILLSMNEQYEEGLRQVNRAITMNSKYAQAYGLRSKLYVYLLNLDSACIDKTTANLLGYQETLNIPDSVCNGSITTKLDFASTVFAYNKQYHAAIKTYSALIDANVLRSDYFLNRGYCYYQLKDYVHAEKDYLKALELPDASKDLLYDNLSLLYYDLNNFTQSIDYSSKRIALNPQNHVPYIDRGLCYRKLKKYKEAEKDFNKSLEIKPDFFRAFGYRAFLFMELGQYQQAFDDASKSVELNRKYAYGYLVLAQAKQLLGITDFCVDLYNAQKYGDPDAETAIKQYCK